MLTLNKSKKCQFFADFEQVKKSESKKVFTILLTLNNTVSQATFGYLLLTVQYLCDLLDTMPPHWSPTTSHPPFYRECYGFERAFFTLRRFLPYTPSCFFQGFPWEPAVQPQSQQGFMLIFKTQSRLNYLYKSQEFTKV